MHFLVKESFLSVKWIPRIEAVRFRRVNVQKPRAPHYERAKYLTLMKPMYKVEETTYLPPSINCKKLEELQHYKFRPDNPLEKIIAKELFDKCEMSKMVCFIHENPISGEDAFQARILLRREKMELENHSKYTVQRAFVGTRYEAVLPLFVCHTSIIFSQDTNIDKLFKVLRKVPQYILLGGILDDRLCNVSQLKKYSEIKDITTARAQLVGTLNSAGQRLVSQISAPSQTLLYQLQHLASPQSEES